MNTFTDLTAMPDTTALPHAPVLALCSTSMGSLRLSSMQPLCPARLHG